MIIGSRGLCRNDSTGLDLLIRNMIRNPTVPSLTVCVLVCVCVCVCVLVCVCACVCVCVLVCIAPLQPCCRT